MSLSIYRAISSDVKDINSVIFSAKRYWGYPEALIELWRSGLEVTNTNLSSREFWLARDMTGTIVSVYSISKQEHGIFELEDCWVAPSCMGLGYGREMFNHMIRNLASKNAKKVVIISDPNAEGFYIKMGAIKVGRRPSQPEGRVLPILEFILKPSAPTKQSR